MTGTAGAKGVGVGDGGATAGSDGEDIKVISAGSKLD